MVVKRVMDEIEDKDKYRIFVPRFEKHHFEDQGGEKAQPNFNPHRQM